MKFILFSILLLTVTYVCESTPVKDGFFLWPPFGNLAVQSVPPPVEGSSTPVEGTPVENKQPVEGTLVEYRPVESSTPENNRPIDGTPHEWPLFGNQQPVQSVPPVQSSTPDNRPVEGTSHENRTIEWPLFGNQQPVQSVPSVQSSTPDNRPVEGTNHENRTIEWSLFGSRPVEGEVPIENRTNEWTPSSSSSPPPTSGDRPVNSVSLDYRSFREFFISLFPVIYSWFKNMIGGGGTN